MSFRIHIRVVVTFAAFLLGWPAHAQDVVQLPSVNLGDSSFMDGVGGPGTLIQLSGAYQHRRRFTDDNGDGLPGNNTLDIYSTTLQWTRVTNQKFFGGYYGYQALLPLVDLDFDTVSPGLPDGSAGGLGDLSLSPFILEWTDHKLFGRPYFQRLNLAISLPTGVYDADDPVNVGSNHVNFNPYYAATLLINDKWAASTRLHYLWNGKNSDPNPALGAEDTQAGQAFHMNYSTTYAISEHARVGVAGYYLKQFTSDEVDGVSQPNSKEQVFGIGPGFNYQKPEKDGVFNFNFYYETAAENRPEGMKVVARYSWLFPPD